VQQIERDNNERSSIPITVRSVDARELVRLTARSQLEAIIRISESLAKLTLQPTVQEVHVDEAIRLFKLSTMDAVAVRRHPRAHRSRLRRAMSKA